MKKTTFLLVFLIAFLSESHAQCTNDEDSQYPSDTVVSENLGFPQQIETCIFSGEYTRLNNILIGEDYIFTFTDTESGTHKYITVTDLDNNTIAFGQSPLTVEGITSSDIKVHYNENQQCVTVDGCHTNTIEVLLNCPVPLNITVSDVTTATATFAWEPGGEETAWEVIVQEAALPAPTASATGTSISNDPEYSTSILQPATTYTFYVRSNCGSEFSPWNKRTFTSSCNPIDSFFENFNETIDGNLPTCWSSIVSGPGLSEYAYVNSVDYNGTEDSPSIELYRSDSGPNADIILVTPALGNLSLGTHRLKFSTYAYDPATIEIGTLDGANPDATFTIYEGVDVQTQTHEHTVDFTGYSGTDTYIGIRIASGYSVFADDIRWELAPLCPDVTEITITDAGINTASLVWSPGGDETEWEIVYGAQNVTDPNSLTPIAPSISGTPEATITGLESGTSYSVWVRSVCGEDDGAWIGPIKFKTACLPVATINENFDTTDYLKLPECWSSIIRGPQISQYDRVSVYDSEAHTAPNCLRIVRDYESTEVILVSPNLSTLGSGTHRIKFYGRSYDTNPMIEVGTLNTAANSAVFSIIEEVSLGENYSEYVVDFTVYDGTDTYVGIKLTSGYAAFLDDIRWEISPLCPDVTEINITNINTTSASFTWMAGGSETEWDIVYATADTTDPDTLTPITPSPTGTPEDEITGLEPATDYKVWIRSACGGATGDGAWIGPVAFSTACLPTATFNENFDDTDLGKLPSCWSSILRGEDLPGYANVATVDYNVYSEPNSVRFYIYNENPQADIDVILVSPNLSTLTTGDHRLKFFGYGYSNGILEIGTLDSSAPNAVFSPLDEVNITENYTEYVVNFTEYNGTDTYVGIRHKTGDYMFLDNIRWELAPLCPDVQEIEVSGTTTTATTVSWNPGGSETNWQVVYGTADITDPDTLTPSPVLSVTNLPLNQLSENTAYNVWVRSVCPSPNGNGTWIGPITFNTQCIATNVPYTEDFESSQDDNLPNCTSSVNVGTGNDWKVLENPTENFTSKTLVYEYNYDNPADTWFFTRGINLTAGTQYTISYRYGNSGDWPENLKVAYGTSADADAMTEEIAEHFEINNDANETNSQTFTPSTSGVYYFGFNAYSDANQNLLMVDDIMIYNTLKNEDFIVSDFKFYPNPVKNLLNLSYTQDISSVSIFNLLGQKVFEAAINANTAQIDMSDLSSGNYLVKVKSDNYTKTIKVVKQ